MSDSVVIRVDNVHKNFKLPHEKNSSVKSAVINFYGRKKTYELQEALRGVNFEVHEGEFFGIVGRNGSGKSTLLKLLAGIYSPSEGEVHVRGRLTPFIELGVGFNQELTGRENVFLNGALLGFNKSEIEQMYDDIVAFAELGRFMDQKLKNYSSGMQVRLAFSIAIRAESDILLLDEVLAVGDADFQRKCFSYFKTLKKNKKTVVFISHDMGAVREFCDRAVLIEAGKVVHEGSATKIAEEYAKMFMVDNDAVSKAHKGGKHSGNGDAVITRATSKVTDMDIIIKAKLAIKRDIEELQYGIQFYSESGMEVIGMNNPMLLLPDIKDLRAGQTVEFEWKIANSFSHGKYSVTLAAADGIGTILDRYEEATSFVLSTTKRSNTVFLPPIDVSIKTL